MKENNDNDKNKFVIAPDGQSCSNGIFTIPLNGASVDAVIESADKAPDKVYRLTYQSRVTAAKENKKN